MPDKFPKFKKDEECAFPERDDCNYGSTYGRCPYMKFDNSKNIFDPTRWGCTFKHSEKHDETEELTKENEN